MSQAGESGICLGSYTSGEGKWEDWQNAELGNRKRRRKKKSKMVRRRKTRKENEKE